MTTNADDIQRLIAGCKKNDRRAQSQLYGHFYRAMATLCTRYTKNEQDASEILNNGFLKIFKNINQFDPGKAVLYTWMRRIMIHSAIDFLRKQRVTFTSSLSDINEEKGVENEVIQNMDADELLRLIRQLPAGTQAAFNLYIVDGFTHREIAEMIGISEGASRWHVSEARKQLKQLIMLLQNRNA